MDTLELASPAKVNLFLEVRGRRPDGYHEIETVFQLVDLCDTVRLTRTAAGVRLAVSGAALSAGPDNLAYRAATLLLAEAGHPGGVRIELIKRIPLGGGLGGGSSNAAAVLAGLNRLWGLGAPIAELLRLGARLGSDVPAFLGPGLCLATGRGEILAPLVGWPARWLVLANPGTAVSTAWAYQALSSKLTERAVQASIAASIAGGCLPWPPTWAFNCLEEAVLPSRPEIRALKATLAEAGAGPVLMSGSGASVFAVARDEAAALEVAARAQAAGAAAWAVRTLTRNPLLMEGEG